MNSRLKKLKANLDRLHQELGAWASDMPVPALETKQLASRLSRGLPLSHGTTSAGFAKMCLDRWIFSQRHIQSTSPIQNETDESILGTDGDVFLFTSVFRYPKSRAGFLFKARIEEIRRDSVATPFDSGGVRRMTRFESNQKAIPSFIGAHELPVPDYRSFLADLLATAFHSPLDYIQPEMLKPKKELWWSDSTQDARDYTTEVRMADKVELLGTDIEAVFLPRSLMQSEGVMPLLQEFQSKGVKLYYLDQDRMGDFRGIQNACFKHIKDAHGGVYAT